MPISHLFLALLVVVIWGVNFLFVKIGLHEISPLLLCALRFLLASVPAVFFIKPPKVPFVTIAAYGFFMFALQFSFVFTGMQVGMTPGMASLIMQVQVFFSMFFAALAFDEQPSIGQILGALVSFSGISLVALHFDDSISLLGFVLMLSAAACWGIGNLFAKKLNTNNIISVVVWGSFISCIPMFIFAWMIEGTGSFVATYEHITWRGIGALLYIVYFSTWVGYGVWNWLIGRYPVSVIVPFTLLVPVVGILSSVFILGEPFQLWKLVTCLLVISGLCINILSSRYMMFKLRSKTVNG